MHAEGTVNNCRQPAAQGGQPSLRAGLRNAHLSGIGSVSVTLLALMSGSSRIVASETASSAARATVIVSTSHQAKLSGASADVNVSLFRLIPTPHETAHRQRLPRRNSRAGRQPTPGDAFACCVAEPSSALI